MKLTHLFLVLAFIGVSLFVTISLFLYRQWVSEDIFRAIRENDIGSVEAILHKRPEAITRRDKLDLTPLHEAAWEGKDAIARLLIESGADVNALGLSEDFTPLHCAAIKGNLGVAHILIDNGVDVRARTKKGETAADIAARNKHAEFAKTVEQWMTAPGNAGKKAQGKNSGTENLHDAKDENRAR